MKEAILTASSWIHLIATTVWIGGIFFILFIAIPSAKQVLGGESGKLMGVVSKKFTPIANSCIILLIITGTVLTAVNRQFLGTEHFGNNWSLNLIGKHILVLGMVAIHFYRGLLLAPRIARTQAAAEKASLQKLSLNLVKVNFYLGLLVLLLSGIISNTLK